MKKVIRTIGLGIVAIALGLTVVAARSDTIPVYHEPDTMTVWGPVTDADSDRLCASFQYMDDGNWRTDTNVKIVAEEFRDDEESSTIMLHVPPSEIDERHASDLYWTLDTYCPKIPPGWSVP
jgi:hypothetical protein